MAFATELCQLMVRLPILSVLLFISGSESVVPMNGCVCPGDTLTYECTAMGLGSTIWTGSALHCTNDEIVLIHTRFLYNESGILTSCNNGAIVARILSVEDNNYTSQLNVTITPDTAGETIECASDDGIRSKYHFSSTIPEIGTFLPPYTLGISNADIPSRQLIFSWSPAAPDCPAIHYNILASNCGSCPTTTNHTTVTCTNIPPDYSGCIFAVQTVVCGNITSNIINSIGINTGTCISNTVYTISISSLATALMVSVVVFTTVITIILRRNKAKAKAGVEPELRETARSSSTHMESMYEDPLPSLTAINTQDNVAYGHTKTNTLQESQN